MRIFGIVFIALFLLILGCNAPSDTTDSAGNMTNRNNESNPLINDSNTKKGVDFGLFLSENKATTANAGEKIRIPNINLRTDYEVYFVDTEEELEYDQLVKESDGTYSYSLTAPYLPGNYTLSVVRAAAKHPEFNLVVLGKVNNKEKALEVANRSLGYLAYADITIKEIEQIDNKWHITLLIDYPFGCCRSCSPGAICAAVCVSCGQKTTKASFVISKGGEMEKDIRTIECKGSDDVWFRDYTGQELCRWNWETYTYMG